jgi:hypothetical protein
MADKKQFSNTKSIVKVEKGIVTFISYHEIATCKQNVGQKEDLMHSNFQMDIDYHGLMQRLLNTSSFT